MSNYKNKNVTTYTLYTKKEKKDE